MQEELGAELAKDSAASWEQRLSSAGIPCGVVREVGEAASMAHLAARNAILPLHIPGLPEREQVHIVNAGFLMTEDGPHVDAAPPRLGENTMEILQSLGYTPDEIAALRAPGATENC
jgi:crotonobetainyl-CoA:carnitine CoA-transferase CaiB-like acyl-CoA transferase